MTAGIPGQFFTAVNIGSVTVATSAIIVVSNTLYALFRLPQKWTAIVVALLISYLNVVFLAGAQWYDWVLAFVNGCLLFCSALGLNEIVVSSKRTEGKDVNSIQGFFRTWLNKR
jgi:zinc transporter ZupT